MRKTVSTDSFTSPFMVGPECRIEADPANTNAGKAAIERLYERGAVRNERGVPSGGLDPTATAIMNFVYEFRYLTSALIDRAFRCPGRNDKGYFGVSRFSSGVRKPYERTIVTLRQYGILRRAAVVDGQKRWYVYYLSQGAREWMEDCRRSGGVVRHPLFMDARMPFGCVLPAEELSPEELMRTLSLAQAAISIKEHHRGLGVRLSRVAGEEVVVVTAGGEGREHLIILPIGSGEGCLEAAEDYLTKVWELIRYDDWDGPEQFSVVLLTDTAATVEDKLQEGLMRIEAYPGLDTMFLFDFVTFSEEKPLDALYYFYDIDTSLFMIRRWPGGLAAGSRGEGSSYV